MPVMYQDCLASKTSHLNDNDDERDNMFTSTSSSSLMMSKDDQATRILLDAYAAEPKVIG